MPSYHTHCGVSRLSDRLSDGRLSTGKFKGLCHFKKIGGRRQTCPALVGRLFALGSTYALWYADEENVCTSYRKGKTRCSSFEFNLSCEQKSGSSISCLIAHRKRIIADDHLLNVRVSMTSFLMLCLLHFHPESTEKKWKRLQKNNAVMDINCQPRLQ
jgi:hypothetical protein